MILINKNFRTLNCSDQMNNYKAIPLLPNYFAN